ncbi:MAG: YCF48-related protein [Chlorobi bacterium]|nr:YCF48-related protein [Chlorobiota bacterium]MCI0715778.1 YCF48-related protein [Chlorobiota bacterium]
MLLSVFERSSNAQAGWSQQHSMPGAYFYSVYFLNSLTGWAAGHSTTIFKTTNGGINWIAQISGSINIIRSVHFPNSMTGWAVGGSSISSTGIVLSTTNGGINWTTQLTDASSSFESVYFLNSTTGWVVGQGGKILSTTNSGVTWIVQTIGTNNLNSVYFPNGTTGLTVGQNGAIIKTINSGVNWNSQTSGTGNALNSVYFINPSTGWSVGNAGTVLTTTNGGTNWMPQPSGTSGFNEVFFLNSSWGWMVGNSGLIRVTTNGGLNWTIQVSGTNSTLNSVHFSDAATGWAVGNEGIILKTTTGGYSLPNAPSNLTASAISGSQINLSWNDNSIDEFGFKIERSLNIINWSVIDSVAANTTAFQNINLTSSTQYYYRTNAFNPAGNSSYSNIAVAVTFPGAPVLIAPPNNSIGISLTPLLLWNNIIGAVNYRLQLSIDSNFSTTIINDSTLVNPYYQIQGTLQNNSKYFWRVSVRISSGWSPYSEVWNFTTAVVGVKQSSTEIPKDHKMYNNHPNPFNPVTKIKFDIPRQSFTTLTVYDIEGKEVKTLVNENLSAGKYEIDFDASSFASGVYYYRIISGSYLATKKMVLIK